MGVVRYSRRGEGCPICGNETGKCRWIHDERYPHPVYYCMEHRVPGATVTIGGQVFGCRGLDRNGLWGEWIAQRENDRGVVGLLRREKPRMVPTLPTVLWRDFLAAAQKRHRQLRRPPQPLVTLNQQELYRRGIPYPNALPFRNADGGLGIPVLSPKGHILAYQVRLHHSPSGGRYRWQKPIHILNYIPVGLYGSPQDTVFLCEGYLKAIAAYYRYQTPTLGVGSYVNLQSSYPLIRLYLQQYPHLKTIALAPDANIFRNPHVQQICTKTLHQLQTDFPHATVAFLSWPDHHLYDIDENPHPHRSFLTTSLHHPTSELTLE